MKTSSSGFGRFLCLLLAAICVVLVPSIGFAEDGFPNTIPHPPVPQVDDTPDTPVPAVPTDAEQYEWWVGQLTELYAQLRMAKTNLMLYQSVLNLDPTREDVQAIINRYRALVLSIEIDIMIAQWRLSSLSP